VRNSAHASPPAVWPVPVVRQVRTDSLLTTGPVSNELAGRSMIGKDHYLFIDVNGRRDLRVATLRERTQCLRTLLDTS
jgi:hypothetical protein